MTKWIEADEVVQQLRPGMTVFVAGATAEPGAILEALDRNPERCAGIRFVSVSIPGINDVDFSRLHNECKATAFFATQGNRDAIASGRIDFMPMHYRSIFDYLAAQSFDVVVAQIPPPGDESFSIGVCADFLPAVLNNATLFVGEINKQQPVPADSPTWPVSRLDMAIECDRPVGMLAETETDAAAIDIGRHVAEIIEDGDCLQVGIGSISSAVLAALDNKNDLGVHSGLVSDGMMALALAGNINGRNKNIDTGRVVSCTTLGSRALLDWVGSAPELRFQAVNYTHDIGVIRQLDQFVSINSAMQVDLFGQVNSDMLNGRQLSGTGGAVDMMRAAKLSKAGRSIIALKATAKGGTISRIVATLTSDTAATILRTDVDYVVTEFGARRIGQLPVRQRANALIEIAAPQFQEQLKKEWECLSAAG